MRHQILPKHSLVSAVKSEFNFATQSILKSNLGNAEFVTKLLDRKWLLSCPDSKINHITVLDRKGGGLNDGVSFHNNTQPCLGEGMVDKRESLPSFYVVRDDLLHPLVNGNKARKLDALLPLLEDFAATDVVTCGGCQSAHSAAVAVSCAERGLKSHLLLRGEEPEILTGYNLVSKLYGNVVYIPRSQYAKREEMLSKHAELVADLKGSVISLEDILESSFKTNESDQQKNSQADFVRRGENLKKVVVINEGAGDAIALLGLTRLIHYLSQKHLFGKRTAINIVVDAGTGTTAVGLALATLLIGLPWKVTAVMLADKIDNYKRKEQNLISKFLKSSSHSHNGLDPTEVNSGLVHWVDCSSSRKFGNILQGEVEECQRIAQQTGILVDPIYTLAGWELATQLSKSKEKDDTTVVVMLHTGGTLGMFGLAPKVQILLPNAKMTLDRST